MSLFDILRYSDTKLTDAGSLNLLPIKLLNIYWLKANKAADPCWIFQNKIKQENKFIYADALANWAELDNEYTTVSSREIFQQALREYSNELV